MISEIVLINPTRFELLSRGVLPIGNEELGYLTAILRKNGFKTRTVDPAIEGRPVETVPEDWNETKGLRLVVVYTVYSGMSLVRKLNAAIEGECPDSTFVVLFGQAGTLSAFEVFDRDYGVDAIIIGEGEQTVLELAKALKEGEDWHRVSGLAYTEDGTVRFSSPRPSIRVLDNLPWSAQDNLDAYRRFTRRVRVTSARGCCGSCTFCPRKAFRKASPGPPWRARSAEDVLDEIEFLVGEQNVEYIEFADEDFLGCGRFGYERAQGIASGILQRDLVLRYEIHTRVDNIERGLFELLVQSGLCRVQVGLEAGNQASLDVFGKGVTVQQNRAAVRVLRQLAVDIDAGFIMFEPYVTPDGLRQNVEFLETTDLLQYLAPHRLFAVPNTPIHRRLEREGLILKGRFVTADLVPDYAFVDKRTNEIYLKWQRWLRRVDEEFGDLSQVLTTVPFLRLHEVSTLLSQAALARLDRLNHQFKMIEADLLKRATCQESVAEIGAVYEQGWSQHKGALNSIRDEITAILDTSPRLQEYLLV